MASIQAASKGYRAFVQLMGVRDSKVFATKRDAKLWANDREAEIRNAAVKPKGEQFTLRQALHKYSEEVSPTKKGVRWEQVRLKAFEKYFLPLDKMIGEVSTPDIAVFRDSRLRQVSAASVLRELTLLASVFEMARLEWQWITTNPCRDVKRPPAKRHREKVYQWWEIKRMLREMGYARNKKVASTYHAVAVCWLTAMRTGMRASELCELEWSRVNVGHCILEDTKNSDMRAVPFSKRAVRLIEQMRGWDSELVFGLKAASLDAIFRRMRVRAGLSGFTFHDSRHFAATLIANTVDPKTGARMDQLTLCKIFGWRDPKNALVYFNPSVQSLTAKLG